VYYTLSRTAALTPYLTVHARSTPYAPGEIAPLGGNFEHLRGDFCGAASLKLSAPPEFQAGDWVRVYLDDDPDNDPTYLGEAEGEPWEAGAGELKCRPLSVTVGKAAWRGKATAGFKDYLTAAFNAANPKGITLGFVPDVVATLKSNTLFEEFGDTLTQALPVASATAGVNSHAVWSVYQYSSEVTHRFVLGEAQTPPGVSGDYANCVRFAYKRPDDVDTYFEGRVQSEVDVRGELWESAGLPTNVTTTAFNPYAGTSVDLNVLLDHPDNPTLIANVHGLQTALTPTWTGHLADGLGLDPTVLQGPGYQPVTNQGEAGNIALATGAAFTYTVLLDNGPSGLSIEYRLNGGSWTAASNAFGGSSAPMFSGNSAQTLEWRYLQDSAYSAYLTAHSNVQPPGFNVFLSTGDLADLSRLTVNLPGVSVAQPSFRTLFKARGVPTSPPGSYLQFVIAPFNVARTRVGLPGVYIWRAGDLVTTDVNVTGVTLANPTLTTPVTINLTRKDDVDGPDPAHPEIGRRRIWSTPQDITASEVVVTGPPASVGWIGAAIADQSALIAYAYGLLRYRIEPVRQWTGLIRTLKRVPCRGVANFEVAGGDVGLDIQRCVYDLDKGTVTVEAGTPVARSDAAAVVGRIESLQRQIRTLGVN